MGCHDFIAGLLSVKTFNFVLFSVNFVRFLCLFGKFSKTEQKLLTNPLTCGIIKVIRGSVCIKLITPIIVHRGYFVKRQFINFCKSLYNSSSLFVARFNFPIWESPW